MRKLLLLWTLTLCCVWLCESGASAQAAKNPFTDVSPDDYFHDAVLWAVRLGITKGMTETTFSPHKSCTRAHIITFLYRAIDGEQDYSDKPCPYEDVPDGAFYRNAAIWAFHHGLLTEKGVDGKLYFQGDSLCLRKDVVEYMWILAGRPKVENWEKLVSPFSDVYNPKVPVSSHGQALPRAVAWALSENITQGTSETTFSPKNSCTRGQIATFLHRARENDDLKIKSGD